MIFNALGLFLGANVSLSILFPFVLLFRANTCPSFRQCTRYLHTCVFETLVMCRSRMRTCTAFSIPGGLEKVQQEVWRSLENLVCRSESRSYTYVHLSHCHATHFLVYSSMWVARKGIVGCSRFNSTEYNSLNILEGGIVNISFLNHAFSFLSYCALYSAGLEFSKLLKLTNYSLMRDLRKRVVDCLRFNSTEYNCLKILEGRSEISIRNF